MAISGISLILMFPLTHTNYAKNLIPEAYIQTNSILSGVWIFSIVCTLTFLFQNAILARNKKIAKSMNQLKDTTQRMIQSEKMASLGMLSAGVAHEINNPLNFIKGGVEILENGLKDEKALKFDPNTSINVIREGLNRATAIVSSLNHFSRSNQKMDEKCHIHEILNNSLVMLQPRLKHKIKVQKDFDPTDLIVIGNEGKLHQAFLNIISNAEQAIPEKGTITVKTRNFPDKITVEIVDDGQGISEENLQKISDPFFTTKPVGKGTGLGLSITYQIIEDHKGSIEVQSEVGKGSQFILSFAV